MALCCGIDPHSTNCWITIIDEDRKVVQASKFGTDLEAILQSHWEGLAAADLLTGTCAQSGNHMAAAENQNCGRLQETEPREIGTESNRAILSHPNAAYYFDRIAPRCGSAWPKQASPSSRRR